MYVVSRLCNQPTEIPWSSLPTRRFHPLSLKSVSVLRIIRLEEGDNTAMVRPNRPIVTVLRICSSPRRKVTLRQGPFNGNEIISAAPSKFISDY